MYILNNFYKVMLCYYLLQESSLIGCGLLCNRPSSFQVFQEAEQDDLIPAANHLLLPLLSPLLPPHLPLPLIIMVTQNYSIIFRGNLFLAE